MTSSEGTIMQDDNPLPIRELLAKVLFVSECECSSFAALELWPKLSAHQKRRWYWQADTAISEVAKMYERRSAESIGANAVALALALKYHDINTVQEGELVDMVLATAIKIERHLLTASDRIAGMVVEAIKPILEDEEPEGEERKP